MSTASKDISYTVVNAIYSALGGDVGFVYQRKDTITLTGSSGTASITCNGVTKTATWHTSLTITASDFVTANAAAYLASGVILTSSGAVLTFLRTVKVLGFTGNTSITNASGTLAGAVVNADTNYPVYKSIPVNPAEVYIRIGEVLDTDDGTKDEFIYKGSVPVIICDESQTRQADKKKAQNILNEVRGVLKPTKASVPSGLIIFSHEGKTEYIDLNDEAKPKLRLVDIYNFLIQ